MIDLVRELDDPLRRRDPELEVEIEMIDDMLLDPWFLRSEAEIALIEDDPNVEIHVIRLYRTEIIDFGLSTSPY